MNDATRSVRRRILLFAGLSLIISLAYFRHFVELIKFSFTSEYATYIILIPFIVGFLLYIKRGEVFASTRLEWKLGVPVIMGAVAVHILGRLFHSQVTENDYLSIVISSALILWLGLFLTAFGGSSFRAASFPLFLVFFMIPIPSALLERLIFFLQTGSTEVVSVLFQLSGTPVYRDGFYFALPGVTIAVAKECSGIRSGLSLLITSLIAGYVFLTSGWRRAVLALVSFPISMIKNAVRIVTLSLLATNVDKSFLEGSLHQEGGIPFFVFALALLSPVVIILRRSEIQGASPALDVPPVSQAGNSNHAGSEISPGETA